MALLDDINRVLRDFERYTGDGQPGAPSGAPLPTGDPGSGVHNLRKHDLREVLKAIAQSMGDPSALQEILTEMDAKAGLAMATPSYTSRAAAEAAATTLPTGITQILVREGSALVIRSRTAFADDPLFPTGARWGAVLRIPSVDLLAAKADLANSGKIFANRALAVSAGQASLPPSLGRVMTIEGTFAEPRLVIRTPGDGTGPDPLFSSSPYWSVQMTVDPMASTRDSLIGFSSRNAAVAAGQASLPSNAKVMVNLEGSDLVMRGWLHDSDDPLFPTAPRFGVITRWPAGGGSGDMNAVRAYAAPRNAPRGSNASIMTDGRTLHRWRGEVAKLKAGVAGAKPKLLLAGDSWNELDPIPKALRARIAEDYPMSGWGWWPAVAGARFANAGAGYSRGGTWTSTDVTATGSLPYGSGLDGNMLTTTGTTETATFTNVQLTELRIFTRNHGGTWRYRVDGGAWSVVTDSNDGALKVTTIVGLSDASHTIEIDTVGNTGRVAIAGYYLTRTAAGIEVLRAGNGGSMGSHMSLIAPNIQDIAANLQPDLVMTILGTNDYRTSGAGVATYIAGLRAMRDAYRAAVPDCGFLFVSPALSGGAVVTPQAQYRDALYEMCLADGHEFYNMTDDWPAYAVSNAQGLWTDSLHPNDAGAAALVNRIYHPVLGL